VSAPFHRARDGIAIELPAHVRTTVRQSMLLVASMAESGAEEAWRLAPPTFDDPLLEAARAVEGQEKIKKKNKIKKIINKMKI
jgi:hypothetical protein